MADEFGIGTAFGAVLGYMGQQEANKMNEELTMSGRDFNHNEATLNRNWQETMSNSAYQRAMADMEKAGLNPMLAYHQGGASTPSGSMASAPAAIPMASKWNAAAQVSQAVTAMQNTKADTTLKERTAEKTSAETAEIEARTPTHETSIAVMNQNIEESKERIQDIIQRVKTGAATEENTRQLTKNAQELIPQIRATVEQIKAHTKLTGTQMTLAPAQTASAYAAAGQAKATTAETVQRTEANLPRLESQLMNLERVIKDMSIPGHQNKEAIDSGPAGPLVSALQALLGTIAIFPTIGTKATPEKPQPGRKDWKK